MRTVSAAGGPGGGLGLLGMATEVRGKSGKRNWGANPSSV